MPQGTAPLTGCDVSEWALPQLMNSRIRIAGCEFDKGASIATAGTPSGMPCPVAWDRREFFFARRQVCGHL
ncbi:MAG: hypothetical protein J5642_01670 [Bacteroidales bacterium]|nr:hypothetical protein [Bacteroidales bacterium]